MRRRDLRIFGVSVTIVASAAAALVLAAALWQPASATNSMPPTPAANVLSVPQRKMRAAYWASRRGMQFGVPRGAYQDAARRMRRMETSLDDAVPRFSSQGSSLTWAFIGPEPIANELPNFGGSISGAGFDATGRISAIAADPTMSGRMFVGAANGGVWMSTDSGATFAPIGDSLPTTAIGAIALDPVNASPPAIYVGTGEGNGSIDSYYGEGLFESTDLGATWIELAPGTFDNAAFRRLAIDPSHNPPTIFAATTTGMSSDRADAGAFEDSGSAAGLWRSTDGGAAWIHYNDSGCGGGPCPADLALDPSTPSTLYVAVENEDVYISTDSGNSFSLACFTNDSPCRFPRSLGQIGRTSVATFPSEPGTVYVMLGAPDGAQYVGFFKSTDSGQTWSAKTVPGIANGVTAIDGTSFGSFAQSFYDQALAVAPNDPSMVFFGGVGIYQSTDSGSSWSFLAQNGGTHSDQHALAIGPDNDTVYLGNDGGAYRFSISGIIGGVAGFTSLNDTLSAGQIQGLGPHPSVNGMLLAGFQDNGTTLYGGSLAWDPVETGDGGFSLFDHTDPLFAYHTFATAEIPFLSRSSDGGITWDFRDPSSSIARALRLVGDPGALFYPPLASDPDTAHRVLFGAHAIYVSTDGMMTWRPQESRDLTGGCVSSSCSLQDVEFAPSDHIKAWALSTQSGSTPFVVTNTTQANLNSGALWNNVNSGLPFNPASAQASSIAPDPHNANVAYLSVSGFTAATGVGHIFQTSDFGTTWTEADGAGGASPLPDVPVLKVLADATDPASQTLYAGTDIGVFRTTDAGATWSAFNLGTIPAVPVFDIEQNGNGIVYVGTHGRGAYELETIDGIGSTPTPTPGGPIPTPSATPTPIQPWGGVLSLSSTSIVFPPTGTDTRVRRRLMIGNPGKGRLRVALDISALKDPLRFAGPHAFTVRHGRARDLSVVFAPTIPGLFSGTIIIASSDPNNPATKIAIDGIAMPGSLQVVPNSLALSFGAVKVRHSQTLVLTLNNTSLGVLHGLVDVSGLGSQFAATRGSGRFRLAEGRSRRVLVRFRPDVTGDFSGTIAITSDDPSRGYVTVSVSGTGM